MYEGGLAARSKAPYQLLAALAAALGTSLVCDDA
jgi:hypothetical protein